MAELHILNNEDFILDRQTILDMIPGTSRDFIEDTLDDLIEDWEDQGLNIRPDGQWMELPAAYVDGDSVKIGREIYKDAYLADRLKGVDKVFVCYIQCSDDLMNYYNELDDALDTFIMNYALISCLNQAFESIMTELADDLPAYCKGCMEIPGVEGKWHLSGNRDIANSFSKEAEGVQSEIALLESGLNKNKFSQLGLIFGVVPEGCTGPWRSKLSIHDLTEEVKEYSGH